MTADLTTERLFTLSAFEGLRLIRVYSATRPDLSVDELLPIIERIEADAPHLDMEASLHLHGLVDPDCTLDVREFYQACISTVVIRYEPTWCKAMMQGRRRFLNSLERNDRDVFGAAGLVSEIPTIEVVTWWDSVAGYARMLAGVEKMQQARTAEALSMSYEIQRLRSLGIDKEPEWKGLDDNFAGYDILSYDHGEFAPVNRMIEVKSTTVSPLRFIVSRNEWQQAKRFGAAYLFHVWDMQASPPVLYERTAAQVEKHIPTDNSKGKWKDAEILLSE